MSQKGAIVCYCICGINYSDVVGWEIIQDNCYRCRRKKEYRSHRCGRSHKEQSGSGEKGRRKHCNCLQLRQPWKPDKGYLWKWRLPGRYLRCKESEDGIEILSGRRNPDITDKLSVWRPVPSYKDDRCEEVRQWNESIPLYLYRLWRIRKNCVDSGSLTGSRAKWCPDCKAQDLLQLWYGR